jgi:hypothetical protein
MKPFHRDEARYTPLFCEENIWWLARSLVAEGIDADRLKVIFFSNPWQSIVLFKQRNAASGDPVCWDYHVVLQAELEGDSWIFDPDSRLPFPSRCSRYISDTFTDQSALPERFRAMARIIPAATYLTHFYSDRSHMIGQIPPEEFPDYPIIVPAADVAPIPLSAYRDMQRDLEDGSQLMTVTPVLCNLRALAS